MRAAALAVIVAVAGCRAQPTTQSAPVGSDACELEPFFGTESVRCVPHHVAQGDTYMPSDVCRRFMHCARVDGGCAMTVDPELGACQQCFRDCDGGPCFADCLRRWHEPR